MAVPNYFHGFQLVSDGGVDYTGHKTLCLSSLPISCIYSGILGIR